jgi:hypothetical protein
MPLVCSLHARFNSAPTYRGHSQRVLRFLIGLMVAVQGTFAFGFSQAEITTAALNTFNTASASFDWDTYLDRYLNGFPPSFSPYDSGNLAWGESYVAMADRAMFDATGDTQHLDRLLDHAETMYVNRADRLNPPRIDEVRNQLMPAFSGTYYTDGSQYSWLVHSAFPSHPVTYAISTINGDAQLQSTYGARADALTADIIETMDSFDADFSLISGGRGVYYEPYLDESAPHTNGQTPYNMQSAAGSTYVGLWKATGEQRFYDRAVALAKTLKEEFTLVGNRYQWRYAPYNPSSFASDISHAGLDVNFVVDAYEAGIVFDDTDIQRLANTMRHIQVGNGFTYRLDGVTAATDYTYVAWLWLRLARYDSALREEMYPIFQSYWNGSHAAANPLFPTVGSALLYETGLYHSLPGDFNGDSMVDAADYIVWRKSDGTAESYNAWLAGFGTSSGSGAEFEAASNVGVPEPPALLCALIGAASIGSNLLRRRRERTVVA